MALQNVVASHIWPKCIEFFTFSTGMLLTSLVFDTPATKPSFPTCFWHVPLYWDNRSLSLHLKVVIMSQKHQPILLKASFNWDLLFFLHQSVSSKWRIMMPYTFSQLPAYLPCPHFCCFSKTCPCLLIQHILLTAIMFFPQSSHQPWQSCAE